MYRASRRLSFSWQSVSWQSVLGLSLGLGSFWWGSGAGGLRAEVNPHLLPSLEPLDLSVFQQPGLPPCLDSAPPGAIKTALTICDSRLTDPSLWWAKQLYGDDLVDNWVTYLGGDREPGRVDVVVNPQVWNTWNYLDRYSFLDRFGAAARRQGYNVRVFDWQSRLLAAHTCDFSEMAVFHWLLTDGLEPGTSTDLPNPDLSPTTCSVLLSPAGRSALRGRTTGVPNGVTN
ncbi:hypothetical protein [Trichothermofontia sp.]